MEVTRILQDLIKGHSRRINFYLGLIREIQNRDPYLLAMFMEMKEDSIRHRRSLADALADLNTTIERQEIFIPGKRSWGNWFGQLFFRRSRVSVLQECEFMEEALQQSYQFAMKSNKIHNDLRVTIARQLFSLRFSYENIRFLVENSQIPFLYAAGYKQVSATW